MPLKTLLPVLENASLEDEADLQERWANLLANAAGQEGNVHPSFPDILRQLTPRDARLLDAFIDYVHQPDKPSFIVTTQGLATLHHLKHVWDEAFKTKAAPEAGDSVDLQFLTAVDTLLRLNLISRHSVTSKDESEDVRILPFVEYYSLTALGKQFVSACRRPASSRERS